MGRADLAGGAEKEVSEELDGPMGWEGGGFLLGK